ncbi:MAG: hypothetical protein Q9222_005449, partial [Ikaeria aurantiellina]
MFAVPGWSVSPSTLKAQIHPPNINGSAENAPDKSEGKRSRKRKRGQEKTVNGTTSVTADNVAELWRRHIDGIVPIRKNGGDAVVGGKREKKKKRRKERRDDVVHTGNGQDTAEEVSTAPQPDPNINGIPKEPIPNISTAPMPPQDGKAKYEQRKAKTLQKKERRKSSSLPPARAQTTTTTTITPSIPAPPSPRATTPPAPPTIPTTLPTKPSNLTPLQTAMRAKLISARFRHLNQTLYTTPSAHASSLFSSDPQAFTSYHTGFRAQVASWPQNPVEIFIREIQNRGKVRGARSQKQLFREEKKRKKKKGGKGKGKTDGGNENGGSNQEEEGRNEAGDTKLDPLPRSSTTGTCTILDLGCGDAHLHASLLPHASALDLSLHSFDLAAASDTPNAHLITV